MMAKIPFLLLCMIVVTLKPVSSTNCCKSYPCQNGGSCSHTSTGYTCRCSPGYSGTECADGRSIVVSESTDTAFPQFERNQPKLYDNGLQPFNNIKFSVKANRDAELLLQTSRTDFGTSGSNYNIFIGAGGWTLNGIRRNGKDLSVEIPGIINSDEYRKFWVSWNITAISVGRGDTIGSNAFITYTEAPKLKDIVGVSFGAGYYQAADWIFPIALNECDVGPCEPGELCADLVFNYKCYYNHTGDVSN